MEKYVLTSPKFKGSVLFGFEGDYLRLYHNEAEMDENGLAWVLQNLPLRKTSLAELSALLAGKAKLELVKPDISFEAFWNAYEKQRNRFRCEPLWEKMSEPSKIKCMMSLEPYENYLKRFPGRAKLDPENYLKRREYENNWNGLRS